MRDLDQPAGHPETPEPPMPPLGGRGNRIVTISIAFFLFAAAATFAWRIASRSGARPAATETPSQTAAPVAPASTVYFAWPGEITEVDVDAGTTEVVSVPHLGAGDPPHLLARVGDRLAFWGYDTYVIDPDHLDEDGTRIARGSWFFVPSAAPDRIWAVWKDDGKSTPYHFEFDHLREIDALGNVIVDGVAHGDAWLDGAVTAGVLLETRDGLIVWDPERAEVVARLPDAPSSAATFDNTVAWCSGHCMQIHLTEIVTGIDRVVDAPAAYPWFNAWDGAFSADGSILAVPVSSAQGLGPGADSAVALVDVASGSVTRLVPGSDLRAGCCALSWDSTGRRLYMARYEAGDAEGWRLSYWDLGTSSSVETEVRILDSAAMVAG